MAYNARQKRPENDIPSGCLQINIFLWQLNNYPCYKVERNVQEHKNKNIWLCKYCATPKKRGSQLYCPIHESAGLDCSIQSKAPKPQNPDPVLKS